MHYQLSVKYTVKHVLLNRHVKSLLFLVSVTRKYMAKNLIHGETI